MEYLWSYIDLAANLGGQMIVSVASWVGGRWEAVAPWAPLNSAEAVADLRIGSSACGGSWDSDVPTGPRTVACLRVSSSLGLSFIGIDPKVSHKFSSGTSVRWQETERKLKGMQLQ